MYIRYICVSRTGKERCAMFCYFGFWQWWFARTAAGGSRSDVNSVVLPSRQGRCVGDELQPCGEANTRRLAGDCSAMTSRLGTIHQSSSLSVWRGLCLSWLSLLPPLSPLSLLSLLSLFSLLSSPVFDASPYTCTGEASFLPQAMVSLYSIELPPQDRSRIDILPYAALFSRPGHLSGRGTSPERFVLVLC